MLRDVRSFHFPFHLRRRVPGQLLSDLVRKVRTLRVHDGRSLRVSEEVRSDCGMNKWMTLRHIVTAMWSSWEDPLHTFQPAGIDAASIGAPAA